MTQYNAGELRHRITIEQRTSAVGSRGQSTEVWEELDKRWARVSDLSGRELEQARQVVATATHRVEMRGPRTYTLTTKHRIKFGSLTFNIGSIGFDERDYNRDDLIVLCERTA